MKRTEKESFVSDLRERLDRAPVVYLTDFTGLDVKSMTVLRRTMKDAGAEYLVVKNRLVKRAIAETDLPDISGSLTGPTGLVFGFEDIVAPARALQEFARQHDSKPAFKIGIMEKQVLEPEQITRIANLPPREVLLSQLAGVLQAPMAALAMALGAKVQEMAGLLDALKQEREEAGA